MSFSVLHSRGNNLKLQPITEYCLVDYDYLPFTFTRRHHSPSIGCYGCCPISLEEYFSLWWKSTIPAPFARRRDDCFTPGTLRHNYLALSYCCCLRVPRASSSNVSLVQILINSEQGPNLLVCDSQLPYLNHVTLCI